MTQKIARIVGAAALVATVLTVPAASAIAAEATPPAQPNGSFELRLDSADAEARSSMTLTCDPNGGSHPDPTTACEQLAAVDGLFQRLAPADGVMCTREYAPVNVAAAGHWNGASRAYVAQFSNACEANQATGGVIFGFTGR